jgi:uncharacterized protein
VRVFVDTSALYALLNEADPNHAEAGATWRALLLDGSELVTHNYVHLEAETLVRRRLGSDAAAVLIDRLLPALTTIWIDPAAHRAAIEAWRAGGGAISLVDQASFVVMRNAGIDVAFAFDANFDRQGFAAPRSVERPPGHQLSESRAGYETAGESPDLVSITELAARSGRSINTIQSWRRRRRDFPMPVAELAAGPIWLWTDVAGWIEKRPPART